MGKPKPNKKSKSDKTGPKRIHNKKRKDLKGKQTPYPYPDEKLTSKV